MDYINLLLFQSMCGLESWCVTLTDTGEPPFSNNYEKYFWFTSYKRTHFKYKREINRNITFKLSAILLLLFFARFRYENHTETHTNNCLRGPLSIKRAFFNILNCPLINVPRFSRLSDVYFPSSHLFFLFSLFFVCYRYSHSLNRIVYSLDPQI